MIAHEGCGGSWEPLPRWHGRYRCTKCRVFGVRGVAGGIDSTPGDIHPYHCTKKIQGPDGKRVRCGGLAVSKVGKRNWRCLEHDGSDSVSAP